MTHRYRRLLQVGLAVLALWATYQGIHHYRIAHPNRNHTMTEPLKDMQTFCVGRFLIDLPKGTTIIGVDGSGGPADFSAEYPVSRAEFERRMAERWKDIGTRKANIYGTPYVEPSKRTQPLTDAVLFAFEHVVIHGHNVNGVIGDWPFHHTEAYLWRDGALYNFTNDSDDDLIVGTMRALQVRQEDQMPTEPGFCGPRSFFPGGAKPESVSIAFRLPTKPGMELRLDTTTYSLVPGVSPPYAPRPDLKAFETNTFKSTTHRDAKRTVSGFAGEEVVEGTTELKAEKYNSEVLARWFYRGEPDSSAKPSITAKLEISYDTAEPPSPWGGFPRNGATGEIGEEEFMAYWDTILNTLRLRPSALQPGDK